MSRRPSYNELYNKIKLAKKHISNKNWIPVNYEALKNDFKDLKLYIAEEYDEILLEVINTILPDDYTGKNLP